MGEAMKYCTQSPVCQEVADERRRAESAEHDASTSRMWKYRAEVLRRALEPATAALDYAMGRVVKHEWAEGTSDHRQALIALENARAALDANTYSQTDASDPESQAGTRERGSGSSD